MPRFAQLAILWLAIQLAKLQLGLAVTCACGLTQQLETDTPIALAVAILAKQTSQAALRFDNAFECRLLEHPASYTFDTLSLS